jgi:hypothetical protein
VSDCARCGGVAGEMTLCPSCGIALRIELTDVPDLLANLDITRSRQDKLGAPYDAGRNGGETPLPFKIHVSEVVWVLHNTLSVWVQAIDDRVDQGMSTADLARWLLAHPSLVRMHPDANQLVDEITDAVHRCRRAIDRPNDQRLFLGPCGYGNCVEELYGFPWHRVAVCGVCGTEYKVLERQEWLREIAQEHLGTASEISGFLRTTGVRCTPSMVRAYVSRGRLVSAGVDTRDRQLFRIKDVLAALQDRYRHRSAS